MTTSDTDRTTGISINADLTQAQESANPERLHQLATKHHDARVRWHAVRNEAVRPDTLFEVLMHDTDESVRLAAQETADSRKAATD